MDQDVLEKRFNPRCIESWFVMNFSHLCPVSHPMQYKGVVRLAYVGQDFIIPFYVSVYYTHGIHAYARSRIADFILYHISDVPGLEPHL